MITFKPQKICQGLGSYQLEAPTGQPLVGQTLIKAPPDVALPKIASQIFRTIGQALILVEISRKVSKKVADPNKSLTLIS